MVESTDVLPSVGRASTQLSDDVSGASATTAAEAEAARIRTSGDNEVAGYLEVAERREPGQTLTPAPNAPNAVVVLDYGSQFSMLIARRIREANVYSELIPWDAPASALNHLNVRAFVLSGGPASVYADGAPTLPSYVVTSGVPVLGICYGMQLLTHALGGRVEPASSREFGHAMLTVTETSSPLFRNLPLEMPVWMSHGDRIEALPPGFRAVAQSQNAPVAVMSDDAGHLGILFHPEVVHTPQGEGVIRNFLFEVAGLAADWTASNFIDESVDNIRRAVGDGQVICALSGGVDSAVAAALVHRAVGDQLTCIFVDNGLLRLGEPERVVSTFRQQMAINLRHVNAVDRFLSELAEVTDPETKRKRIGETFIRIFEHEAKSLGQVDFIAQGTTYPDVIESASTGNSAAAKIKTHHNVGGLPKDMRLTLIEPLRNLFKDEVRRVGKELGLSDEMVYRQPFPGPGLAIRVIGDVTRDKLDILRRADWVVMDEIKKANVYYDLWQSFAVLTDTKTVGVQGDFRTYGYCVALRFVTAQDAMTADWARLPYDLLATISTRIVNEVTEVNRVVYDITSKPPGTIEWE
ncbi:MAG: glutamine-hydrolyzing GMP synthase [Chloroflexi bacterium]|nr:glutamine-hydrolyzing GMP synthase [Chloroflexota bacterium]MDA1002192.1 glutamine-hydrolyzing GMP synthase [Chloroflexota bacterium]